MVFGLAFAIIHKQASSGDDLCDSGCRPTHSGPGKDIQQDDSGKYVDLIGIQKALLLARPG